MSIRATVLILALRPGSQSAPSLGNRIRGQLHRRTRPTVLTVAQVAKLLGICTAIVYAWAAADTLPHVRIVNVIRVRFDDVVLCRGPLRPHTWLNGEAG